MQVFSYEICEICRDTFWKNTTGPLLLIIVVSVVAKGELGNETVNFNTKAKAYVPI